MKINRIKLVVAFILLLHSFSGMIVTVFIEYFRSDFFFYSLIEKTHWFYGITAFSGVYLLASIKQNEK